MTVAEWGKGSIRSVSWQQLENNLSCINEEKSWPSAREEEGVRKGPECSASGEAPVSCSCSAVNWGQSNKSCRWMSAGFAKVLSRHSVCFFSGGKLQTALFVLIESPVQEGRVGSLRDVLSSLSCAVSSACPVGQGWFDWGDDHGPSH